MPEPIDRRRVEVLTTKLLGPVQAELAKEPHSPDNVYVALNALAFCVAVILTGTDGSLRAQRFFHNAVVDNVAEMRRQGGNGNAG